MSPPLGKSSPRSDSEKYHLLPEDDSEIVITDSGYSHFDIDDSRTVSHRKGSKKFKHWLSLAFLTVAVSLFSGLAGFYIGQTRVIHIARDLGSSSEDTPWDALKAEAITYETQTFSGHFLDYSEYQGPPNPSLDAKWKPISALYNFGVERSALAKVNKTQGLVQWPNTTKYMVGLETFHHLHCLNYIRMYSYMDYYEKKNDDMLFETLEERTNHKDHCIEALRQKLMCTPDVNVYSWHWLSTLDRPSTDFKTQHRCVNWSRFFGWLRGQIVKHRALDKPPGAEVLF